MPALFGRGFQRPILFHLASILRVSLTLRFTPLPNPLYFLPFQNHLGLVLSLALLLVLSLILVLRLALALSLKILTNSLMTLAQDLRSLVLQRSL